MVSRHRTVDELMLLIETNREDIERWVNRPNNPSQDALNLIVNPLREEIIALATQLAELMDAPPLVAPGFAFSCNGRRWMVYSVESHHEGTGRPQWTIRLYHFNETVTLPSAGPARRILSGHCWDPDAMAFVRAIRNAGRSLPEGFPE